MLRSPILVLTILLLAFCASGCVSSAAGGMFLKTEGKGEERELVGVVNGVWFYDIEQNKERLRKLLPGATEAEVEDWGKRYQVRVGINKRFLAGGTAVEVALLPEGWTYSTSNNALSSTEVQPGDVVRVLAQRGRLVDKVIAIKRRCDEAETENERPEHSIGCFEIDEFSDRGYGGKKYFLGVF